MVMKELESLSIPCIASQSRMENRESLSAELDAENPIHVINCAGVTGRPNVDWCENNKQAAVRTNVIGALNAADLCDLKGIHHTLCATGCIFEYDETHQMGDGNGFKEDDAPTLEEQSKVLAAGRSNNELDTTKLMGLMQELEHEISPILDAVRGVMKRMKHNLIAQYGDNYLEHLPRHQ